MFCARLFVLSKYFGSYFFRIDGNRTLDFTWVTANLGAPFVENTQFVRVTFWRAEVVVLIGVFRNETQCALLATATNHQWNRTTHWLRVQFRHAFFDNRKACFKKLEAPDGITKLVAVFGVIALEPTGTNAQHKTSIADVVDCARHVCQQLWIAIGEAGD